MKKCRCCGEDECRDEDNFCYMCGAKLQRFILVADNKLRFEVPTNSADYIVEQLVCKGIIDNNAPDCGPNCKYCNALVSVRQSLRLIEEVLR